MTEQKDTFWLTISQPVCPALSGVNMEGWRVAMAMRSVWGWGGGTLLRESFTYNKDGNSSFRNKVKSYGVKWSVEFN